jgi:hypothetical protein
MFYIMRTAPEPQGRIHRVNCLIVYLVLGTSLTLLGTSVDAKKPDVKSEVARTTISGYVQAQFRATNEDDAVPNNTFTVHRGRFQLESELTNSLSAMLEVEAITDRVDAKDVYLRYKISPEFSLKAGQMKKPFSFAQLQSPRKMPTIDRPLHVQEDFDSYLGRDIGLMAEWGPHEQVELAVGVFNGAGAGESAAMDSNNAKDIVGRVELMPGKWLTMALNASSHGLVQEDSDNEPVTNKRVTAYGADASFRRGGFRVIAEGLFGDKPEIGVDARMLGLYVTMSYKREGRARRIAAEEYGGRIEFADSDRTVDNDAVTSVTPYIGLYFHPNARLQICPVMRFPQQGDTILEFIAQAQIEF